MSPAAKATAQWASDYARVLELFGEINKRRVSDEHLEQLRIIVSRAPRHIRAQCQQLLQTVVKTRSTS